MIRAMKTSTSLLFKPFVSKKHVATLSMVGCMILAPRLWAQSKQATPPSDALHQLNNSVEALVQRISPSIVQIQVSGYASSEDVAQGQTSVIVGKQRSIGSG